MLNPELIKAELQKLMFSCAENPEQMESLRKLNQLIFGHEKKQKLAKRVGDYLAPNYWPDCSTPLEGLKEIVTGAGYDASPLSDYMIAFDRPENFPLGYGAFLSLTFHKMESGKIELVGYIN